MQSTKYQHPLLIMDPTCSKVEQITLQLYHSRYSIIYLFSKHLLTTNIELGTHYGSNYRIVFCFK